MVAHSAEYLERVLDSGESSYCVVALVIAVYSLAGGASPRFRSRH